MKLSTILLFYFIFFATLNNTQADKSDNNYFDLSFAELMAIDITGSTLTPETLSSVPSAVTVFNYEEIHRMGLDTLDELMNLVPGFQSYTTSAASQLKYISSRGRRINNNGAEILIMIDGQRYDDPRSSGSMTITPKIPLNNIEHVEFFRGPVSSIYGSNAMQGMVNITTRSNVNEIGIAYGSFEHSKIYFLGSKKINNIDIDIFGQFDEDNGDKLKAQDSFTKQYLDTDDPHQLADLNVKIKWQETRINFQHSQYKAKNFYEFGNLSDDTNKRNAQFNALSLQQNFNWLDVNSHFFISYHSTDLSSSSQLTPPSALFAASGGASDDALFLNIDFDDSTEVRVQWHNDWNLNTQSQLQFGVEVRHIDIPETIAENNFDLADLANQNFPIRYYGEMLATTTVQIQSNRDIVGFYGQLQHQLFASTQLTLGFRYDDFSDIGSQLSPRLAIVQTLNDNHTIKLLYGEAFRSPTENELNLVNNPVTRGNPDLKPETVQSFELIWLAQWATTTLSVGYFENHFKDSIEQIQLVSGIQFENIDQEPVKGIELEVAYELNQNWQVRASYNFFSEKPDTSFRETDQQASMMLNYQKKQWIANLIATYTNERDMPVGSNDNRITLDDYLQVFAKIQYRLNSNWHTYLQAKNLLDENYKTPAANASLSKGVPNRGRELLFGITRTF
jgi:outer membrane cobalamin receptor